MDKRLNVLLQQAMELNNQMTATLIQLSVYTDIKEKKSITCCTVCKKDTKLCTCGEKSYD